MQPDQVSDEDQSSDDIRYQSLERENNITTHNFANVAFCLMLRDEQPDAVLDWIRYHYTRLGVNKFYIYDHSMCGLFWNSTATTIP